MLPQWDLLERTRLEKAVVDHGFDITPVFEGDWLACRSSQLPERIWLKPNLTGSYALAVADRRILEELVRSAALPRVEGTLPAPAGGAVAIASYNDLYNALGRVAALARSLPRRVAERFARVTRELPQSTEAERLVVSRIGQQLFREALIDYWQGKCAVTGLDVVELLRASHIKPWSDCANDDERLDVFNGLLLAPHLDALFDGGWITFDDGGGIQIPPSLSQEARHLLSMTPDLRLAWVAVEHKVYLAHHRHHVFLKIC